MIDSVKHCAHRAQGDFERARANIRIPRSQSRRAGADIVLSDSDVLACVAQREFIEGSVSTRGFGGRPCRHSPQRRVEARRPLGVPRSHVVELAERIGEDRGLRHAPIVVQSLAIVLLLCAGKSLGAQEVRFAKSLSGPSGHVSGSRFVFDETRNRFVYPQDKSLIIYFEWSTPAGLHTISAVWKSPDGRPQSIPADIKVETKTPELTAYWTFDISPGDVSGVWTLETRVDGAPGRSHSFELYVPVTAPANPDIAVAPSLPTTDQAYRKTVPSLVIVRSLDEADNYLDSAMGFVYGPDQIATAFEAVDGASRILVEFADGSKTSVEELGTFDRTADWALIPVPTGTRVPLESSSSSSVKVGERVLTFTLENNKTPVAAVVTVTGRDTNGKSGVVQVNPSLPAVSAGAPVLDTHGEVFGILGAWATPGSRIPAAISAQDPAVWRHVNEEVAVAPIEAIKPGNDHQSLATLAKTGVFTPPIARFPALTYATTTDVDAKRGDLPDRNVSDFPRSVPAGWVVSLWTRREKLKSARVEVAIFDVDNRKQASTAPKKVTFGDPPARVAASLPLSGLSPGTYRLDLLADGVPVWRTFIRILENGGVRALLLPENDPPSGLGGFASRIENLDHDHVVLDR